MPRVASKLPHVSLPLSVRAQIAILARKLACDHRALFASDPIYRKRASQFLDRTSATQGHGAGEGQGGRT